MGEQIAADLVDLIFLFDRVASDPPTATTSHYLEWVSQPSSPFYNDYLEYRQGRIGRAELVRRFPHVAMIGDSLTQHFYISSPISLFWRARTQRRKNWFLDTDPDPASIWSVYERLQTFTPLVATEYNGAGALVAPTRASEGSQKDRPNAQSLRTIASNSAQEEISRFDPANLEAFFKARRKAEALHAKNPALYPYFESGNRSFESLKSPYQSNMVRLGLMLNGEMRVMVSNLDRQLTHSSNVRVQYF